MDHLNEIIILFHLLSYNAVSGLEPVNVITIPSLKFGHVNSIISGPSSNVIIADSSAIWGVNIESPPYTKHIIAGSATIPGYREGTGNDARFHQPRSIILFNETHVIASDSWNQCLRAINLLTYKTSKYAGTCLSAGFRDGYRITAKFNAPRGLLNRPSKLYIADTENHALRVLNSDHVSTLKSGSPLNYPYHLASWVDDVMFATSFSGILKIHLRNETVNINWISGSFIGNFVDGGLKSSRYNYPYDITFLNEHILTVADNWNNRLRIVDLKNKQVSSICSGLKLTVDGNRTHCSFFWPYALLVYADSVIVGEAGGSIRRMSLYSFIDESEPSPVDFKTTTINMPTEGLTPDYMTQKPPVKSLKLEYLAFLSLIIPVVIVLVIYKSCRKRRTIRSKPTDTAESSRIDVNSRHGQTRVPTSLIGPQMKLPTVPQAPIDNGRSLPISADFSDSVDDYDELTIVPTSTDSANYASYATTTSEEDYIVPNSKPQTLNEYGDEPVF